MRHLAPLLLMMILCGPRPACAGQAECEAAFRAHDPVGVCLECAELVMDGAVPDDPDVWIYIAMAQWNLGERDYGRQKKALARAAAPGHVSPWDLLQQKRYEEAREFGSWFAAWAWDTERTDQSQNLSSREIIEYLDLAIEAEPHPDLLARRGKEYETLGKKSLALKDYWQAYWLCRKLNDFNGCIEALSRLDPEGLKQAESYRDPVLHYRKNSVLPEGLAGQLSESEREAIKLYADRKPEACLEQATRALEEDPGSLVGHLFHASALLGLPDADFPALEVELAEVLQRDPDNARAHLHHGICLRLMDRHDESLQELERAFVLDPELETPNGAQQRALTLKAMGRYDEALDQLDTLLRAQPGFIAAWQDRVHCLLAADRPQEALATSGGLLLFRNTADNHIFRAQLLERMGNDDYAVEEWVEVAERNPERSSEVYPSWSSALQRIRDTRCGSAPANLLESLAMRPRWTFPAGNLLRKHAPNGMETRWQADGTLWVGTPTGAGFVLLEDGVLFSRILADGSRGPATEPQVLGDGRMVYPLDDCVVIHSPSGALYFGYYELWASKNEGSYVDCADMPEEGPFRFGLSANQRREVDESITEIEVDGSRRTRTVVTLADGSVYRRETAVDVPHIDFERSVTLPGIGRFVGETMTLDRCAPQTGVLYFDDGSWALVIETQIAALGPQGQELKGWQSVLAEDGTLTITNPNVTLVYDRNGDKNFSSNVIEPEPEPEVTVSHTGSTLTSFNFKASLQGNRPHVCYRCRGAGYVWKPGGASQERIGASSSMSSGQREDFYTSSASVRTTYSSGSMVSCPACGGSGQP